MKQVICKINSSNNHRETLTILVKESQKMQIAQMINYLLTAMLLISFIVNSCTLGTPLIDKYQHHENKEAMGINMFKRHDVSGEET